MTTDLGSYVQELLKTVEVELLRRLSRSSTAAVSRQHLSNTVCCVPLTEHESIDAKLGASCD